MKPYLLVYTRYAVIFRTNHVSVAFFAARRKKAQKTYLMNILIRKRVPVTLKSKECEDFIFVTHAVCENIPLLDPSCTFALCIGEVRFVIAHTVLELHASRRYFPRNDF